MKEIIKINKIKLLIESIEIETSIILSSHSLKQNSIAFFFSVQMHNDRQQRHVQQRRFHNTVQRSVKLIKFSNYQKKCKTKKTFLTYKRLSRHFNFQRYQ